MSNNTNDGWCDHKSEIFIFEKRRRYSKDFRASIRQGWLDGGGGLTMLQSGVIYCILEVLRIEYSNPKFTLVDKSRFHKDLK